jgi:hypothetical protein
MIFSSIKKQKNCKNYQRVYRTYLFNISLKNNHLVTQSLLINVYFLESSWIGSTVWLLKIWRPLAPATSLRSSKVLSLFILQISLGWVQSWLFRSGFCGSVITVINWPPGSGSLLFFNDLKKFQEKVQYFTIFYDLLTSWQHFFLMALKKYPDRILIRPDP